MRYIIAILTLATMVGCSTAKKNTTAEPAKPATKNGKAETIPGGASTTSTICSIKSETRTIEIVPDGKGCKTIYTKSGTPNTVGTGRNGTISCEKIAEKVKGNLEAAGYKCK